MKINRNIKQKYDVTEEKTKCQELSFNHHLIVYSFTSVPDTSTNPMDKAIGNENKLQRVWQSIPLRPQRIFILGDIGCTCQSVYVCTCQCVYVCTC